MKKVILFVVITLTLNLIKAQEPAIMWELVYEPENNMRRQIVKTWNSLWVKSFGTVGQDDFHFVI